MRPLVVTARHRVRIRQLYRNLNVEDLESLLKRVWVERAWTFQEIVLSSNSTIVCGGKALPWDRLHRGLRFLLEYEHGGYSEAGERSWRNSATITAWMNLLNIWLSTLRQSDWTFADSEQNDEPGSSTKTRMGPRRSVQIYWESFFSEIGLLIGSKFLDVLFLLVPGVVFFSVGFAVWPVSDGEVTPQLLAFGLVGTAFVMGGALFVRLVYCRGGESGPAPEPELRSAVRDRRAEARWNYHAAGWHRSGAPGTRRVAAERQGICLARRPPASRRQPAA